MKKPTQFEMDRALRRASKIIDWMMPYIGNMAPPDGGLSELNDHYLFVKRNGYLPKQTKKYVSDQKGRPINQRPCHDL
jgi:hypothetical protein